VLLSKVGEKGLRFVVSHISRKTSEIWGTPRFVEGERQDGPPVILLRSLIIHRSLSSRNAHLARVS
jgi:hypothetical protein